MAESFHTDADLTGASAAFDGSGVTVGESYTFAKHGRITHIRFRATPTLSGGTYTGALWRITDSDPAAGSGDGTLYGQADFGALTADAWNLVALPTAKPVRNGFAYRAGTYTSVGRYMARTNFYNGAAITRGNITGVQDAAGAGGFTLRNGVFFYATGLSYPQDVFNSATYLVDVVYEPANCIRPTLVPELTSDAGLYAFGIDFTTNTPLIIPGVWWYQPSGGTVADVTARLYTQATQTQLATGTALAASLVVDEWNLIEFSSPYTIATGTTYTAATQTSGRHAYDNTVSLPTTDPTGRVTMTNTRYESGGGYPATSWGSGQHGIDVEFTDAPATTTRPRLWLPPQRSAVHRASRW